MQFALTYPSAIVAFDAELLSWDQNSFASNLMVPNYNINGAASGVTIYDSSASPMQASIRFTADFTTGSTANTYGDVTVLLAQSVSNANPSVFTQNCCVEVLKF